MLSSVYMHVGISQSYWSTFQTLNFKNWLIYTRHKYSYLFIIFLTFLPNKLSSISTVPDSMVLDIFFNFVLQQSRIKLAQCTANVPYSASQLGSLFRNKDIQISMTSGIWNCALSNKKHIILDQWPSSKREVTISHQDCSSDQLHSSVHATILYGNDCSACHRQMYTGWTSIRPPGWWGGRRSPAVACWASDHWVASSNPLMGKFRH